VFFSQMYVFRYIIMIVETLGKLSFDFCINFYYFLKHIFFFVVVDNLYENFGFDSSKHISSILLKETI